MAAVNQIMSNLAVNPVNNVYDIFKSAYKAAKEAKVDGTFNRTKIASEGTLKTYGSSRIMENPEIAKRLGYNNIDHKAIQDVEKKRLDGLKNATTDEERKKVVDQYTADMEQLKKDGKFGDIDKLNNTDAVKAMFMNDKGEYSKTRIGGAVAGSYMAANVIGHGSLGIPFISTASWDR